MGIEEIQPNPIQIKNYVSEIFEQYLKPVFRYKITDCDCEEH